MPTLTTPQKPLTTGAIANAYGLTIQSVCAWKRQGRLTNEDFLDPGLVAQKLELHRRNKSPQLCALKNEHLCELIEQRLRFELEA